MSVLAIDIGNSNITIGSFRNGSLTAVRRSTTPRDATADQLEILLEELLRLDDTDRIYSITHVQAHYDPADWYPQEHAVPPSIARSRIVRIDTFSTVPERPDRVAEAPAIEANIPSAPIKRGNKNVLSCSSDADVEDACQLMEQRQVRRLLVTDGNTWKSRPSDLRKLLHLHDSVPAMTINRFCSSGVQAVALAADTALYVALLLAAFTIVFGTRHLDATERHEGMVAAIAFESAVKLVAFLAVGGFVTWGLFDGMADIWARAQAVPELQALLRLNQSGAAFDYAQWFALTILSALAVLLLPRQFQVAVVDDSSGALTLGLQARFGVGDLLGQRRGLPGRQQHQDTEVELQALERVLGARSSDPRAMFERMSRMICSTST